MRAIAGQARPEVFTWLLALLLFAFGAAHAQNVQPVPPLTAHVIDQTGTLDPIQLKGLEDKLLAFEQASGTQIAILMVATTLPEDDASFANRVGNAWKIGRKGIGDGLLIVVAKNDRKIRIEVAKTLEGAIPDLAAKRIIDEAITPNFRKGDFAAGLYAGVDRLIARIKGEALPAPAQRSASGEGFDWMDLAIFLFIAVPIAGAILRTIFGRKLGSLVTGGGVGAVAWLLSSSMVVAGIVAFVALVISLLSQWSPAISTRRGRSSGPWIGGGYGGGSWGAGGSSSGSGGGGWGGSGGGGDFGGGGASGDW
jgi:uncharacterized protein